MAPVPAPAAAPPTEPMTRGSVWNELHPELVAITPHITSDKIDRYIPKPCSNELYYVMCRPP